VLRGHKWRVEGLLGIDRRLRLGQSAVAGLSISGGNSVAEPFGPDDYREAMARVAGGVHVVTTAGAQGRAGVTATAVVSVSDDPPTLLACINAASRLLPLVDAHRHFAVSVLSSADAEVADVFAGRTGTYGEARFEKGAWADGRGGQPLLASALATLECRLQVSLAVATHRILVGEVSAVRLGATSEALVWLGRGYRVL
jgi:flavin reductase (DIM6/NTAB) family NADH-FMN oxidoreductase RutF